MAFNGSGVFTKLYQWVVEQASPPIEISKLDAQETDFATGLSNCILRDGTGVPTAATPWNSQNLTGVGTLTAVTGTFSGTVSAATGTISGNATVGGTLGVTGVITGVGSGLTNLNASNLSSGTVPSARVAGAYTAVTAIGNTGSHVSFGSFGNVTIAAPSSGVTLDLTSVSAGEPLSMTDGTVTAAGSFVSTQFNFGTASNHPVTLITNNTIRATISAGGNVTIAAPSSGVSLTLSAGGSYATPQFNILSTQYGMGVDASGNVFFKNTNNGVYAFNTSAGASSVTIQNGMVVGSPTGGDKGAGTLNTAGNIYVNNVQVPRSAFANVAGSGGAVSQAQGVAFTSHTNGTGIYVLALTGFSGTPVAVAGPRNGSGIASVTSISSSSVTVSTFSDAGVPTDVDFSLIVQGVS